MSDEEAFKKVELAQIYFEDGAPKTALKLLKEAGKTLGASTVAPHVKICQSEIRRRARIMGRIR